MRNIKFHFIPRTDADSRGLCLIYLYAKIKGKPRKRIPTDFYVPENAWDHTNRKAKKYRSFSKNQAFRLNQELESLSDTLLSALVQVQELGQTVTYTTIQQILKVGIKPFNLIDFTREYLKDSQHKLAPATYRSYEGLIRLWEMAMPNGIGYDEIETLQDELEKFMLKSGNNLNTRKKRHKQTKSMLNKAKKAKFPIENFYVERIGEIKGNRNHLLPEELNRIIKFYQTNILRENQHKVIGQFLFSCFTACRFSDMQHLNHKSIQGNSFVYIAEKTKRYMKRVEIPLQKVALKLIENPSGKLFDMYSESHTNALLKEAMNIIGIKKHISFHCARHTFATLYIYLGGDVTNLQQLMCHSNISTTMVYVQMAKRLSLHEQHLFDEAFGKQMKIAHESKTEILAAA